MTSQGLAFMSATELGGILRDRKASPVEAVEAYLQRIEQLNPSLNAYITVLADEAMASARQAEAEIAAGKHKGPLHGVPVGVKDQIHTQGILTTDASKIRADFVPNRDATVVANLKRAGAVIIGKLNMTEFAMGDPITSAFGVTCNPWDTIRSPGTSSTGSGAATAAFMCATSLGEDTGGSVRGPAANCGLVGLRPSWGRVSRFGVDGASWSLDTIGPISRTGGGLRRDHRCHRRTRFQRPVHLGGAGSRLPSSPDRRHPRDQSRGGSRADRTGSARTR